MKTVRSERVESHVERVRFGMWDAEEERFVAVYINDPPQVFAATAAELGVSEDLVRALVLSFEMLATAMHEDLVDIWKRMDALEQRVRCQVGGFDVRRLQGKKR